MGQDPNRPPVLPDASGLNSHTGPCALGARTGSLRAPAGLRSQIHQLRNRGHQRETCPQPLAPPSSESRFLNIYLQRLLCPPIQDPDFQLLNVSLETGPESCPWETLIFIPLPQPVTHAGSGKAQPGGEGGHSGHPAHPRTSAPWGWPVSPVPHVQSAALDTSRGTGWRRSTHCPTPTSCTSLLAMSLSKAPVFIRPSPP